MLGFLVIFRTTMIPDIPSFAFPRLKSLQRFHHFLVFLAHQQRCGQSGVCRGDGVSIAIVARGPSRVKPFHTRFPLSVLFVSNMPVPSSRLAICFFLRLFSFPLLFFPFIVFTKCFVVVKGLRIFCPRCCEGISSKT